MNRESIGTLAIYNLMRNIMTPADFKDMGYPNEPSQVYCTKSGNGFGRGHWYTVTYVSSHHVRIRYGSTSGEGASFKQCQMTGKKDYGWSPVFIRSKWLPEKEQFRLKIIFLDAK